MIAKKLLLGFLILVLLILVGSIFDSLVNRWTILPVWLAVGSLLFLLNNGLCKKWFSFDKLETYKYSWRQFGIITLLFICSFAGRKDDMVSTTEKAPGSLAIYIFFVYLMLYVGERYFRKRVLKVAVKSLPFVLLASLFLIGFFRGGLRSTEPKAVRYLDIRSGNVFEISGGDIEKAVPIFTDLVGTKRELLSYDSLLVMFEEDTIEYDRFIRMTSEIEKSVRPRIRNMRRLADEIQCSQYRDLLVAAIGSLDNEFLGYSKYKDGVVRHDSVLTEIGRQLVQHVGSEYTQLVKHYASIVRIEPGDQIDEQHRVALLRAEAVEISMALNEYELAFVDFSYGDLSSKEFRQRKRQYESALAERFQRCDSLMQLTDRPVAIRVFGDYLNYDDLNSSIPHQRFQALSSMVRAFMVSDSASYAEAYDSYYRLCEESDAFWMNFLASFVFE